MGTAAGMEVELGPVRGDLTLVDGASGLVVFAHGSGSSRKSARNVEVATALQRRGVATLLIDLLTDDEERVDLRTRQHRFDIPLLAERLVTARRWAAANVDTTHLRVGYFGASTGGGAALVAAAREPDDIGAVVSRGGRPDLAGDALTRVRAPTLLIVGGRDDVVIELNQQAHDRMTCERALEIVPGATHLFEEPGALDVVSTLAGDWFVRHLAEGGRP